MPPSKINLDNNAATEILEAVQSQEPVRGLTHNFYRYPARFSPLFARATIKAFTKPGDLIYDPFMGGGTSLIEGHTLGRRSVGTDINSLAVFISKVKTTVLSESDLSEIKFWAHNLIDKLTLSSPPKRAIEWAKHGYQHNISNKSTWPIRKTLELALAQIALVPVERQKSFARCVLLRTAQWALDCRIQIPSAKLFRQKLLEYFEEMLDGARDYATKDREVKRRFGRRCLSSPLCLNRSVVGIENNKKLGKLPAPSLIITSPPYPGVHALYHRWQIKGRKETPAPFWIANSFDGNGASFYTMGDRKQKNLIKYFQGIQSAFASLARVIDKKALVVQMVAFSEPSWQLGKYLETLGEAGFSELKFFSFSNNADGRLWRNVPNRKWYAGFKGPIASSKEVVLFHKLK